MMRTAGAQLWFRALVGKGGSNKEGAAKRRKEKRPEARFFHFQNRAHIAAEGAIYHLFRLAVFLREKKTKKD